MLVELKGAAARRAVMLRAYQQTSISEQRSKVRVLGGMWLLTLGGR
jgi:hypothetical protein